MRRALKLVLISLTLILYFVSSIPFVLPLKISPYWTKRNILAPLISFFCKLALLILQVKVEKEGELDIIPGSLILANHVSYLDMVLLYAQFPSSFISTVEVKNMPFFGLLATAGGSIFIERRSKENLDKEMRIVEEHLQNKVSITFFPEAKATNGQEVIRFRRPFFEPAAKLKKDVYALTINYTHINGEKTRLKNRDLVFWYRQSPIFEHLINLLSNSSIKVHIKSSRLSYKEYHNDSAHIADQCHKIVSSSFVAIK